MSVLLIFIILILIVLIHFYFHFISMGYSKVQLLPIMKTHLWQPSAHSVNLLHRYHQGAAPAMGLVPTAAQQCSAQPSFSCIPTCRNSFSAPLSPAVCTFGVLTHTSSHQCWGCWPCWVTAGPYLSAGLREWGHSGPRAHQTLGTSPGPSTLLAASGPFTPKAVRPGTAPGYPAARIQES